MEARVEVWQRHVFAHRHGPLNAFPPSRRHSIRQRAATIRGQGSAWQSGSRWQLASLGRCGAYTPLLYGVRAEVIANASRLFVDPSSQNDQGMTKAAWHFMRDRGGFWLGSGVARPLRVAAVQIVNVSSGGMWTSLVPRQYAEASPASSLRRRQVPTAHSRSKAARPAPPGERRDNLPAASELCRPPRRRWLPPPVAAHRSRSERPMENRLVEVTMRGGQRFGDSFDVTPESRQWASGRPAVWLTTSSRPWAGLRT